MQIFCHLNAIHKRIVEPECNIQKLNDRLRYIGVVFVIECIG